MAVQIMGATGAVAEVDSQFAAQRVSVRPPKVSAWSSYAARSGLITLAAANALLWHLRYLGSNLIMVRRLSISWTQTTAFTAAQRLELGLYVQRSLTVVPSGGTAVSAASGKHRGSLNAPNVECMIATTAGYTAGTAPLDTDPIGLAVFWGAQGNALPLTPLFSHDTGDHPLILAPGEGVRLLNLLAMSAAGVGVLSVTAEVAETDAY